MKSIWFFPILFACLPVSAKETPGKDIVIGINSDHSLPFIEVQRTEVNPVIKSGILKGLGEALAKELNSTPKWLLLPKKRLGSALVSGQVSIICNLTENWQPEIKEQVQWSHDVYASTDFIVFLKGKSIQSLKDISVQRIGTILNFLYPYFDDLLKEKVLIREDSPNNESNIRKLINGRIKYVLMSNFEFAYYQKIYRQLASFDPHRGSLMTKCALSPHSPFTLTELNRAIDTIKRNGTLQKILTAY